MNPYRILTLHDLARWVGGIELCQFNMLSTRNLEMHCALHWWSFLSTIWVSNVMPCVLWYSDSSDSVRARLHQGHSFYLCTVHVMPHGGNLSVVR